MMRRTPLAARSAGRPSSLRRLVPVAALGAALALSACQTQSPIQTDASYAPADGVAVDLGSIQVRDLVVISSGKDQPGVLSGSVSNSSADAQRIAFALPQGQPVFAESAAFSQARLSEGTQVQLLSVPASPGGVIKLTVQSATAPAAVVTVPVLPASGYYATLAPTSMPSTPTTAP
ncbi:MAG: hypothetical protein ABIQ13_00355 [Pedococcus sp.]